MNLMSKFAQLLLPVVGIVFLAAACRSSGASPSGSEIRDSATAGALDAAVKPAPGNGTVDSGGAPPPGDDAQVAPSADGGDAGADSGTIEPGERPPNVLLIIADDLGVDSSTQYSFAADLPNTPVLDELAARGLVFDNAWATPACTTTRGTLISGLHGVRSGVDRVPDTLPPSVTTIQSHLKAERAGIASAVVGKWHLSGAGGSDLDSPLEAGTDYYAGNIAGVISDYQDWPLVQNGVETNSTEYHTTVVTDLALDWITEQSSPWFMWLAYVAPHAPFHLPPEALHSRPLSGTAEDIAASPRQYYLAAIEAMDTELGRLLASMPEGELDNTLVVFVGDNGTPARTVDQSVFPRAHAKGSLYEGGIRVPLIVAGPGVTREGEREPGLVNTVDLFPTLTDFFGVEPVPDLDGQSFAIALGASGATTRTHNYTEFMSNRVTGWATRNDRYKLIELADGTRELYDSSSDLSETRNLIDDATLSSVVAELENYATERRAQ